MTKKIISGLVFLPLLVLVAFVLAGVPAKLSQADSIRVLLGDVNCDDEVNTGDAVMILRYSTDLITQLTDRQMFVADANKSGEINTGDAVEVLRMAVNLAPLQWLDFNADVTPIPTETPINTPDVTPTSTLAVTPTATPVVTPTPTAVPTATPVVTPTPVPTPAYKEIRTVSDLLSVRDNMRGSYKLMNDIDMFDYTYTNGYQQGRFFEAFGTSTEPFFGVFDGNGYSITGLFLVNLGDEGLYNGEIALFGYNEGTIMNLHVEGEAYGVTGGEVNGAALLCVCNNGTIANCSASGWVEACARTGVYCVANRMGGLVGTNRANGVIRECWSKVNVDASSFWWSGVLCGHNLGKVENCFTFGYVTAAGCGGLVGDNALGKIANSYSISFVAGGGKSNYAIGFGFSTTSYGTFENLFALEGQFHGSPTSDPSTAHDDEAGTSYTKLLTYEQFNTPSSFNGVFSDSIWVLEVDVFPYLKNTSLHGYKIKPGVADLD